MTSAKPVGLRTEYRSEPLGLDMAAPRLGWRLEHPRRGALQSAYRILAASSPELLAQHIGDLWDSGRIRSDASQHIHYAGTALQSEQRVWWKVRIWDKQGEASDWSAPASWSMGLLSRGQWNGRWIGLRTKQRPTHEQPLPAIYLHRAFRLRAKPVRATAYATALGAYELHLNGQRVGVDHFAPEWTDYNIRALYQTYDVTDLLQEGDNAAGTILAPGWYAGFIGMYGYQKYGQDPCFLMQLNVEYADGTVDSLHTDESWRAGHGPVTAADMQMGEYYDARRELAGWATSDFDGADFAAAQRLHDYRGLLTAHPGEPIRVMEHAAPQAVLQDPDGKTIYDFGYNVGGWVRMTLRAAAGTTVTLRFGEVLDENGRLYTDNLRHARQTDRYIAKGSDSETYEPRFAYHGFRYVEISADAELDMQEIEALIVYSALPRAGRLKTSNAQVNRLHDNIVRTQRANFVSVPTDCPQRDERHGWTGDVQVFARTAAYNMDVAAFFTKWMGDLRDAQRPSGAFPDFAPFIAGAKTDHNNDFTYTHMASSGWGDAGVIIPWTMYEVYGDTEILEASYDAMQGWVDFLENLFPDGIRDDLPQYGDWLSVPYAAIGEEEPDFGVYTSQMSTTPYDVFGTAYFAYSTKLLARSAELLGHEADAARYRALFARIRTSFNHAFVAEDGRIRGNTQTVYLLAMHIGLLSEAHDEAAFRYLVEDIERRGIHISTGFHGIKLLLPTLSERGRDDLAFRLLLQDTYPSWLYSVRQGATSIWERWDGWTEEHGFQRAGMNSFNHYALGTVGEWLYRYLGGIDLDPDVPGYRHIRLQPRIGGEFTDVACSYDGLYGRIESNWRVDGKQLTCEVRIPANCTATLVLPAAPHAPISESGVPAGDAEGVQPLGDASGGPAYRLGAGVYRFKCELA
ncbi:family 78 glycoside hydrolase catalytic domain [Paenibacillus sp. IB182496]|uniref:alpha-L-rhamnosidase n=1 Tax=Paenibacillus sabuli TaxID=2772509 RepID=A0A927BWX0_9BACL|nr:alpha-L-rhamnosidase [Paenibacillus sabuli]MBD2848383.1 family 78 glycoside hydrolase catalytic domain [Paenibacillus sabuli]